MKTLFWLPVFLLNWLMPFNKNTYKPSTNKQRIRSEKIRNEIRLAMYYAKKLVNKND